MDGLPPHENPAPVDEPIGVRGPSAEAAMAGEVRTGPAIEPVTEPVTEAAASAGDQLRDVIRAMPKAELHLHLDGSLRPATALELARTRGIDAPRDLGGIRAALIAPPRGASQADLLRAFDLPIALLQDAAALARVTAELVEDKAADRVRYVEIRWGPLLHTRLGLPLDEGIAAVCRGAKDAAGRTGTVVRLICTAIRSHDPADNVLLAEAAATFTREGLTGFDLAGPEAAFPDPLVHRAAFDAARAGGLRITLHAGEWGGAEQVRRALLLRPERIAHGPGAVDDPDLCVELSHRRMVLDLCPTSNVQAGIVPLRAAHPLAILHRRGVPVTLSTDDLTVSDITLSEEYATALEEIGLWPHELWAIDRAALDVAFADEATLAPLRAEFNRWAASHPEIAGAS
ncbi:MAG TPA: adenosine deaminase [Candidatus Saccharimonadales bacterium]|nr:adenosine deaminase [Candidatus Saccharimonadales bacterium]